MPFPFSKIPRIIRRKCVSGSNSATHCAAGGMPLLQLERLTFRFVEVGFGVLSAALVLGVACE